MTGMLLIIILLGAGIGFLLFVIIRSIIAPKRVEMLAGLLKQGKAQTAIKGR